MNYIAHHGIKGMHWGVRRSSPSSSSPRVSRSDKERNLRDKLTTLEKSKKVSSSDLKRFKYRNHNLASRIGGNAAGAVVGMVVKDVLTSYLTTGSLVPDYSSLSKQEVGKRLAKIGFQTAKDTIVRDALAKSAAKKYSDDGKTKVVKDKLPSFLGSNQDWMEYGINTIAPKAIKLGANVASKSLNEMVANRAANEAAFNKWGANILSEKVADVVWSSPDMSQTIYKGLPPGIKPKKV